MASGNKTTINRSRSKVRLINFNDHINEGYVFLAYGQRLSDLLNDDRNFLPLETDAGEVRVVSKRSIMEVEVLDTATPGKSAEPSGDIVPLISGSAFDILGVTAVAGNVWRVSPMAAATRAAAKRREWKSRIPQSGARTHLRR